ncbi:MAG: adenine phosphoribosyltransferase [Ruminococcus sp.]|nr:adenine phosphoribosyltransferase [Ruminococcus sp.]
MAEYYTLQIAGLTRKLKICPISDTLEIAAFILFSDVELTEACACALAARAPACDFILTVESKGIPLAYEMARQMHVPYIVARKSVKGYMTDVLSVQVKSITTASMQTLYLDGEKAAWMRGKRVLLVDDVVSTGESLRAMQQLVERACGMVAGNAAALAEGDAASRTDLIYLEPLPLFVKD